MREDRDVLTRGLNGLKAWHVVVVPVADDHVGDRLFSQGSHFCDDGLSHERRSARIEHDDSLLREHEDRIPFLGKLEWILSNPGPNARCYLLPGVLKGIGPCRS